MHFISPLTEDEVRAGRRLKRGEIARDGDYIGFDLAFMDAAPSAKPTLYLTDTADPHAWARNVRDAAREGQNEPQATPHAMATSDAAPRSPSADGKAMRDAARAAQFG